MLAPPAALRLTLRRLARSPLFTGIALLTLALGIGANSAIFSVIEGILLKPMPYPHPEQLVALWHTAPGINLKELNMSPSLYFLYSEESRVFSEVSLWNRGSVSVTGLAEPEEVPALFVTHRLLPMIGVQPALGRPPQVSDESRRSERVILLADSYWRARFGGDPSVIGRRIRVDGDAHEVVGILPPDFRFGDRTASVVVPMRFNRDEVRLGNFSYQGLARLRPGVTIEQAAADVARLIPISLERFAPPGGYTTKLFADARIGPNLRSMKDDVIGDIGTTLWVLMATVGLVLLIACANVANLLLVRAEGRQQEFAIRAALGAGWGRIAREMLTESILLSLAGGLLGLGLAAGAVRWIATTTAIRLPRAESLAIDPWVVLFTLGVALATGLLFGLLPIWKYARPRIALALRGGGRSMSHSRERHRARNLLVIVQVALAVVLLISSGLMIRTFQALRHVDPGFSSGEGVQTLRIFLPESQVKEPAAVLAMEREMGRRLQSIAGVTEVAIASGAPLDANWNDPVYAQDQVYAENAIPPIRRFKFISPGYVRAAGSRLIAGREFNWNETAAGNAVALVSENMAREVWKSPEAALGKRIRVNLEDEWREVIGVLADLRDDGIDQKAPGIVYWPLFNRKFSGDSNNVRRTVNFIIRSPRAGSTALLADIRRELWAVNPEMPLANVRTFEEILDRSLARTSFTLLLLAISGGMALILGVVGIYGVIAYSVSQRTREIGIRIALGAPLAQVTALFVRHGLVLSVIGAVCGLAAAAGLTRLMKSLLYSVSPGDPLTYGAVAAGLIAAAALASYLPARRATRVDPADALRAE